MNREKLGTFVLGGVTGAVVGILVAPRSGRELRGAVSYRAGEARERGREGLFEARERARERRAARRSPRPEDDETTEMTLGETFAEPDPGAVPQDAPRIWAVPSEGEPESVSDEDRDELRRRVRQTRERLRRRRPESGADG